jgi:hypothetical protein
MKILTVLTAALLLSTAILPGRASADADDADDAVEERVVRHLPDWLKPHYNHGLLATLDGDNNVVSINVGDVVTDDLFAKFELLPKLRELDIENTTRLSAAGLAHLGRLSSLEKLHFSGLNHAGSWLGDVAIEHIVGLPALGDLTLNMCGTTDAGVKLLARMPQLTRLSLGDEARLTDAALDTIARLKHLKQLKLYCIGGSVQLGKMRFSEEAIRQLAGLTELEELDLIGQPVAADALVWTGLKSLRLGMDGTDDAGAARIATFRRLERLELFYTKITNEGLKQITELPALGHLWLDSDVITDVGVGHLRKLTSLKSLSLRGKQLTDKSIAYLAEMKSLERVDLDGGRDVGFPGSENYCFSVRAVHQLKALPNLHFLWLSNFDVGDYTGLKQLTQLRELTLVWAEARGDEVDALQDALPQATVHRHLGSEAVLVPQPKTAKDGK